MSRIRIRVKGVVATVLIAVCAVGLAAPAASADTADAKKAILRAIL